MTNNQNIQRDIDTPDENPERIGVEMAEPAEVLEKLNVLHDAIAHDQPVTYKMIDTARDALKKMTVRLGNREVSFDDPELQKNIQIWKEILNGNYKNILYMTAMTNAVCRKIPQMRTIDLISLTHLTDEQARFLVEKGKQGKPGILALSKLPHITDKTAEILRTYCGRQIWLSGLTSITNKQAESLAQYKGDLMLGLEEMNEEQAAIFRKFEGKKLSLSSLVHMTNKSAELLAPIRDRIQCSDTISTQLTDAALNLDALEKKKKVIEAIKKSLQQTFRFLGFK